MDTSNFDRLLERYVTGQLSDEEREKLEAWLDVVKTEDTTDMELSNEDEEQLFQRIVSSRSSVSEVLELNPFAKRRVTALQWTIRIAASLLLVCLVVFGMWKIGGGDQFVASGQNNAIDKMILNDGSIVWLREGSQLTYAESASDGTRRSVLEGEALFEVAKDPERPFVIQCGNATLRVIGTSFNVRAIGSGIEVRVLTGRVNLSSTEDTAGIDILANEMAIYEGGGISKQVMTTDEVRTAVLSSDYDLKFVRTRLADVTDRLSRKFNVKFVFANDDAGDCTITADFTDHSLESTLTMIGEVLDVQFGRSGDTITIRGAGCRKQ